jgi:hypothetical protein
VFQDLDKSLETLLKSQLPASLDDMTISFAAPDDVKPQDGGRQPMLSLFLFAIQENKELRSVEPIPERAEGGQIERRRPPVRIDCHYLASAFSRLENNPELDEHRILGEVMKIFLRFRELPAQVLQGSLIDQPVPVRASTLQPTTQESGAELWQAFKIKPRPSLRYTFTISVDPAAVSGPFPPVRSFDAQAAAADPRPELRGVPVSVRASLGGAITDAQSGQPLAGALVQLVGYPDPFAARLAASSDRPDLVSTGAGGGFAFFDLPDGTYALAVSLPGAGQRYGAVRVDGVNVRHDAQGKPVATIADATLPPTGVSGRVTRLDNGRPVAMAQVMLAGSGELAFTDRDGKYMLMAIEPGKRKLQVSANGLAAGGADDVPVDRGKVTAQDIILGA